MSESGGKLASLAWPDDRTGRLRAICFGTMALVTVFDLIVTPFTRVTVDTEPVRGGIVSIGSALATAGALLFIVSFARREQWSDRVQWWLGFFADLFALLALNHLMPLVVTIATYVVTPFGLGLRDAWLAWPEQAIGRTQARVYRFAADAGALPLLGFAYSSLGPQSLALPAYFGLVRRNFDKAWEFAAYSCVAATAVIGAYWMIPGVGDYKYYGFGPPIEPPIWLAQIETLRAGLPFRLDDPAGLVCFLSFHFVFASLLTWAYRDERYVFPFIAALNFVVFLSIMPIGWHYLIDAPGGALWAAGAVMITNRLVRPKV